MVVVDGERGVEIVDPDAHMLANYPQRPQQARRAHAALVKLTGRPALTRDGVKITLRANVELSEEAVAANRAGAEGIGLYRTEFLFLDRDEAPDEGEQFEAYLRLVQLSEEAVAAYRAGAEGFGLYRTEFLFLDRDEAPDEVEQFEAYLRVGQVMEGAPVIIRTVVLGVVLLCVGFFF